MSVTAQVRTSYLPSEIVWGHRLFPLTACLGAGGQYAVDYTHFNDIILIEMPKCSAKDYHERSTSRTHDVIKPIGVSTKDHQTTFRQRRTDKSRSVNTTHL
jgi:Inward rectifier potassium channel C-terminal domain